MKKGDVSLKQGMAIIIYFKPIEIFAFKKRNKNRAIIHKMLTCNLYYL